MVNKQKSKIAIIGMSGLFPGSSKSEEFWDNLMAGKDLTGLATKEDFGVDPELFFQPEKGVVDKCYSLRGGYIRDFHFDPEGYQLPADFLARQDKLYQWSLYVAREALRDTAYQDQPDILKKCGLILGNLSFPTGSSHKLLAPVYTQTAENALRELLNDSAFSLESQKDAEPKNDILAYTPSQMVAEALGLGASHYALDAACATSLYAIKLACDELMTGKADLMLAGAVCASDQLFIHMGFSIFHAYAPADQKFVPLDKNSAGLVSSEGAGMVLLKRLEDAERDGDHILGVIGGIGLSNDGRGKFLLSPNPKGQRLAFERAYAQSGISPEATSYLECHATGTPLGDKTEMNSIADFFSQYGTRPMLGSVKSNMGHLLTAAGMTGLFKVLLAMDKGIIPPNINLKDALVADNGWEGREQMILEATPWKATDKQAGINSFGFGGTNAHMVIWKADGHENIKENPSVSNNDISTSEIAIVGMDVHFGACSTLEDFYTSIYEGRQHFRELPEGRWKGFDENQELLKSYGFTDGKAPRGAYIEDFEIDLLRYKIQPKEAETLEPQQALILKVADNALKDAGLDESQNVAVLIAMESELAIHHYLARWDSSWQLEEALEKSGIDLNDDQRQQLEGDLKNSMYYREGSQTPSQHTSFVGNIMASRIAALWDFSGPAFTVSCGENSVFKALEVAQNLLSLGEVDAVVVGGVDFSGGLENVLLRNHQEGINPNPNPSLSFNQGENGWLVGEGAGAVVLKRTDRTNPDKIYAVIEAVGKAAESLDVGYIELAATGFNEQDKKEQTQLFNTSQAQAVALGSVKTNIGHTYAASGIAALIKTALCLHHRFIPGIPNWRGPKEAGQFEQTNYYFPTQSRPWILQNGQSRRMAAVNGLEGLQIRLSEPAEFVSKDLDFLRHSAPQLIPLKGDTAEALLQQLSALEIALETPIELSEIAGQFFKKFKEKKGVFTLALVGKTKTALQQEIAFFTKMLPAAFQQKSILKTPKGSYFTPNPLASKGKVAFVYPGSATAYTQLGQDIFQLFPDLYPHFEQIDSRLDQFIWPDYLYPKLLNTTDTGPNIHSDAIAMMSVGVFFSAIFTHLLRKKLQLEPDIAFGYSMGECSSMWYSLGLWAPTETKEFQESPIFKNRFSGALELLADHWGISSKEAQKRWVSLILLAPKEKVEALIANEERVYLTFVNTATEVVISGDREACTAIATKLGCEVVEIPFQNVIHHDFCGREREGLLKMHHFPLQEHPAIDFYSSISGDKIQMDSLKIAENSTTVCCEQVDFPTNVKNIYAAGARIFIELGANATCTGWIKTILKKEEHLAVSINQKGKADGQALIELLAQLLSHGLSLDLSVLYPETEKRQQPRSFLKKIIPGGARIYDILLSDSNREQFAGLAKKRHHKTLVTESALVLTEASIGSKQASASTSNLSTSTIVMESNTAIPQGISTDQSDKLGENGLKLWDFSSGEQLEGKEIVFSQEDLEEFATGKIANVFGPEYGIIDTYSRRVMLPMYPYLLVSRVTGLKGKMGEFNPSFMQTEYDIPYNAWFTTDRQIPWAVSVESGQCDLLLISYLGIDFQNKGKLVYRLLDCTLTFVDDLPFEGQTLRYDISINSFVRNGENLLFFFSYRCYVEDRLVLKMDGGCAGFFTDQQLEEGNGVVYTESELELKRIAPKRYFTPLLKTKKTTFNKEDLRHLINGEMEKCFEDESYFANGRNPSLCLPPEKILMIDHITSVDLTGGAYGLGYIVAEKDLNPDDWYFPCHFRDDEVLAGSLQAEGGGNLLRFFMLMLGLQRLTKDARYQPVFDLPQKVRCRKQVTPKDTKLIYKLEIKEIGLIPNPYVIGDLEIISDGVVTVHFENLGLQLREKDNPRYLEETAGIKIPARSEGALMNEKDITTFALDDLSKCFGEEFAVYDGRTVSRQPNTDLQLISRVLKIDGERHHFKQPSTIYAEYDVPVDAWYYKQNSNVTMPYSVLMEIALQPCGLLGAYLGSTLQFADKNLYFRNLDGDGELFDLPNGTDLRGKTISNKAVLVSSVALGGTILQNYTFELSVDGQVFYKGKSSFGFFPGEALAQQVGLDNGKTVAAWYESEKLAPNQYMQIKLNSLYGKMKLYKAPADKPHYRLAEKQLNLLDDLIIAKNSGQYGKGYVHAIKQVRPYEWFYTCHFYQDPVMPGSLGVEAILQAMQVYALQQDLGKEFRSPKFVQLANHKTVWKYRGQILTHVREMKLEVHIKSVEKQENTLAIIADAYLWNDQVRIYQVTDLALGIEEGSET
ncbi:MAG: hypothetical protein DHS20C18_33280 [Saprospiraceae bacterium]|nr:MAG: hypothetical protein DHS20C18_33280 [Saprospiraceae bacterium]